MKLTDARLTKRKRMSLYIDDEFFDTVEPLAWEESGLKVGCSLDEEALDALMSRSSFVEAKRRALNMLTGQSYTKKQLSQKLTQKTSKEAATAAADRMEELGLLNDEDYARRYASDLYNNRMFAVRRVRQELSQRGIDRELIDDAVEFIDSSEEPQRAVLLLRKKLGTTIVLDEKTKRRASALLERYGYGFGSVKLALREFEFSSEDDEECCPQWE